MRPTVEFALRKLVILLLRQLCRPDNQEMLLLWLTRIVKQSCARAPDNSKP